MKFKIKYKRIKYKVGIKDKISITMIKIIICIKRNLRRIKMLIPENIWLYLILTITWVLFGIINYYFYLAYNYQKSILDIVVELKNSYFTTVIIAIVLNVYNSNFNHRKKLINQHEFYVDTMRIFENIFDGLIGNDKYHYLVFYNNLCLTDTINYIKRKTKKDIENWLSSTEYKNNIEELIEYIPKIKDYLKIDINLANEEAYYINNLENELKELKNYACTADNYLKKINIITYYMIKLIDILREPWRKDLKYDLKILQIIEKNNADIIKNDFYYSMLIYGHDFGKN